MYVSNGSQYNFIQTSELFFLTDRFNATGWRKMERERQRGSIDFLNGGYH